MPLYLDPHPIRLNRSLEEFSTPFRSYMRAKFDDAWMNNFTPMAAESYRVGRANAGELLDIGNYEMGELPTFSAPIRISPADAHTKAELAGVKGLPIPEDGISEGALDILIARRKRQMANADSINRSPTGVRSIAGFGVALGAGILDPVNVTASLVPVIGQARYALALERASGALGRAGVRASVGGIQGAVGTALIEPAAYAMHQGLQDDYKMLDSLMNIGFGAAIGGTLHAGFGALGDAATGRYAQRVVGADQGSIAASTAAAVAANVAPLELRATGRTAPEVLKDVLAAEERRVNAENVPGFQRTAEDKIALEVGLKPSQLVENVTPELERAFEIAQKPGALRSAEEKIFLEGMMKGRETDYLNARLGKALEGGDATEVAAILRRFQEIGQSPQNTRLLIDRLSQETKDAAILTAIAQSLEGKYPDLTALVSMDRKSGILSNDPLADVQATAARQSDPASTRVADPSVSAEADKQIADAPKTHDMAAAQEALMKAESQLTERAELAGIADRVKAEMDALKEVSEKADDYARAAKAAAACGI